MQRGQNLQNMHLSRKSIVRRRLSAKPIPLGEVASRPKAAHEDVIAAAEVVAPQPPGRSGLAAIRMVVCSILATSRSRSPVTA